MSKYWGLYRIVLVTNTRDFVLLGEDAAGQPTKLETFRLADSAEEFDQQLQKPRAFAHATPGPVSPSTSPAPSPTPPRLPSRGTSPGCSHPTHATASHASRPTATRPSLTTVRSALEEALGVKFEGDRGAAFFRSTLVQTLFYGVFSAWVLWSRQKPAPSRPVQLACTAVWHLRAPVLQALFQQAIGPQPVCSRWAS